MEPYVITYKEGVMIITHPSGANEVRVVSELREQRQEILTEILCLERLEEKILDHIKACAMPTLWTKVKSFFRKDRIV